VYGGLGNDILTGGIGADTFYFPPLNGDLDTITDFTQGEDFIRFRRNWDTFAALNFTQVGADVTIDWSGGTITVLNANIAYFTIDDFLFQGDIVFSAQKTIVFEPF